MADFVMRKKLLVIGCSPAWERMYRFDEFHPGEVNRAVEVREYPAGKATNLCRAVKEFGCPCETNLVTLLDEVEGARFRQGCEAEGIQLVTVSTFSRLRTCTNLISRNHGMTELIEEASPVTAGEMELLLHLIERVAPAYDGVVLAGSIPNGSPEELAGGIAHAVRKAGKPLYIDNWKNFSDMASWGCVKAIKINREELQNLTHEEEAEAGIKALQDEWPDMAIGVTDGANPAWLGVGGSSPRIVMIEPPKAASLVNPLGAGDACSGVFFANLIWNRDPEESFAEALDAATKSCASLVAGSQRVEA